ncbi:phosphatidylinositol-3-phosphatase SAC1 [Lutzomyia longipalpis]|uniref:phosphatidylinositol-3-phosphatase SAC1 n=1 Tax=Lutzomyia longipalpis TaxID=7200 RepID=UPI0024836A7A|nr:phosphatidylinositol-3-phosphatase SAC1 [Lutzomyia longipalpis]
MDLYDDMNFYSSPDKFVVEPNGQEKCDVLVIDRITQTISVEIHKPDEFVHVSPHRRICGILGTIKLLAGHYLIVATHRVFVGVINGQAIWRLAGFEIYPYIPSSGHLSEIQKTQNDSYLYMIRRTLSTPNYYFSYTYDITHTLQRLNGMPPEFLNTALLERADTRFVWNGFLMREFRRPECRKFSLPVILGFVSINQVNVNGNSFTWSLITRRSIHRAGTRLFCRGIDQDGNVANFVETEQIIEYLGDKVSFVQTRGSIPIYWRQTPNLRYKPPPEIIPDMDHMTAFAKHMDSQLLHYGRQVLINLIDHRGAEDTLEKAYANAVALLGNTAVRYEAFDFHAECRKMRWDRLNILIDRLAHEQDEFAVFHLRRDGTLLSSQDGVFRTNCVDCLDRTNVVQSMLAKRSLAQTLTRLGILQRGQAIENCYALEMLFMNVWADNADLISTQYSGTGALKTDFTRTGKRTKMGLVKDGINSITRYYKNNFTDGMRQDGIDLLLGNYVIQDGEGVSIPSPLNSQRGWKYLTFPSVLMFAVAMFFASSVFPQEYNTENLLFLLFWGAMVGVSTAGIFKYGKEFVDWPKLLPPFKVDA